MSFQHALRAVLPHASTDKFTPILNAVQVDTSGTVRASDKYTLGESTFTPHGGEPGTEEPRPVFTLALADAKALAKVPGTPEITLDDSGRYARFSYPSGPAFTFPTVDGSYPSFEHLFQAAEGEPVPVDAVLLNLTYLARFDAKHLIRDRKAEKTEPGRLTFFGPSKPVLFTFGTYFRGLLVPVRSA